MSEALITLKQSPVIEERLQSISEEIKTQTAAALALAVTEDTVKAAKKQRAELGKSFKALEAQRKQVKEAVMAPYDAFEAVYKRYVTDVFKPADAQLKARIDEAEDMLRQRKADEVRAYYDEYAAELGVDFLPFDRSGIRVMLSGSANGLKGEAKAYLDKVAEDLTIIKASPDREEVLVEYKSCLSLSRAILAVKKRHDQIEAERARQAQIAAERARREQAAAAPLISPEPEPAPTPAPAPEPPTASAPAPEPAPVRAAQEDDYDPFCVEDIPAHVYTLTMRCTSEELDRLKAFLASGQYLYELSEEG